MQSPETSVNSETPTLGEGKLQYAAIYTNGRIAPNAPNFPAYQLVESLSHIHCRTPKWVKDEAAGNLQVTQSQIGDGWISLDSDPEL